MFYDEEVEAVCFIVKKDDESNIINGYIIGGIFQSQEDIDYSAFQDGAEIGGLKYVDMNGDGVITEFDKTPYQSISISPNETFKLDVIIGK